jgi:hypothetical protein
MGSTLANDDVEWLLKVIVAGIDEVVESKRG